VGYYAATKFAVEGLSDSLSKEVGPLGIKVTVIEPGPFRTDWAGRSLKRSKTEIADYAQTAHARYAQTSGYSGKQPGDPMRAAEAIIKVTETENPPLRLLLGRMALDFTRQKLNALEKDIIDWEDDILGADYPEAKAS
jgi:NAD(P)-dependent dehydrogenase (short-subunit alcohol dehydrogenase family)